MVRTKYLFTNIATSIETKFGIMYRHQQSAKHEKNSNGILIVNSIINTIFDIMRPIQNNIYYIKKRISNSN